MNLPYPLLGEAWYWFAWLIWLPLMALALWRAPWSSLQENSRIHVFLGMVVALVLLWSMKAGVKPGLDLHLTGAMLFTLVFGLPLAFVGLNLVLLAVSVNAGMAWEGLALNALFTAGLGVLLAHRLHLLVESLFPRHFFVFVFLKGFFGAALTVMGIGLAFCLVYGLEAVYAWVYLFEEYLPYYLLLGFSEAWISGMVLTLMLVYRPAWVSTFDESIYTMDKASPD